MKTDCSVCNYKGPLAVIKDMSAYMDGYVCPKCGVVQVKVEPIDDTKVNWVKYYYERGSIPKPIVKMSLWDRVREFFENGNGPASGVG